MADVGVSVELPRVVADLGFGNGAFGVGGLVLGRRVIGREDGGGGSNDGANGVVHLLGLGLIDQFVRHEGAGARIGGGGAGGDRDLRVLVEVVVVLRLRTDLGADLSRHGQVDLGVLRGERGVGGTDNGAIA